MGIKHILLFFLLGMLGVACGQSPMAADVIIDGLPTLPGAEITAGEEIYTTYCAGCHGENLEGQTGWEDDYNLAPPLDESGRVQQLSDEALFEWIKYAEPEVGRTQVMPAYEPLLDDEEIWDTIIFLKSRWPEEVRRARQP